MIPRLKKVPVDIYLLLKNNTPVKQNVVLFDSVGAYNSTNALVNSTSYSWDMTQSLADAPVFGYKSIIILAKQNNNSGNYQLYSFTVSTGFMDTITKVVNGLNSLGIGTFYNVGNTVFSRSTNYLYSFVDINNLNASFNSTSVGYSINGSIIYPPGYTTGLITPTLTQINPANPFWINTGGLDGPFNRTVNGSVVIQGLNQQGSIFGQVNAPISGTYYIGLSLDRRGYLYVNNKVVVDVSTNALTTALANNINSLLSTTLNSDDVMNNMWHIIPVQLNAGINIIQGIGITDGTEEIGVGFEVYDNTAIEIANATNYSDLNVLYTSTDYLGQDFF